MSHRSDLLHDRYADLDFTDAKPVAAIPALARLQAEAGCKTRITLRLDGPDPIQSPCGNDRRQ